MNPTTSTTPKKIVLIEDDVTLRESLSERLTAKGFIVSTANDGEAGLEKMISEQPDAIIIDVMLPKKNGFAVIKEFRTKQPQSSLQIIMLTDLNDMQYAATAIEEKVFSYIIKSDHSLESLASLIEKQLNGTANAA
jgi:DNA-binding response OmpR family regulator